MHPLAMENTKLWMECNTEAQTNAAILIFSDLPELTIEIIFFALYPGTSDFAFWFSIAGTLTHVCRLSFELRYELSYLGDLKNHSQNVDITFLPHEMEDSENGEGSNGALLGEGINGQGVLEWAQCRGSVCRVLTVTNCSGVGDAVAGAIADNCCHLEKLSAADTGISDAGARALASSNKGTLLKTTPP